MKIMTVKIIKEAFVFSLMIVPDETNKMAKYDQLLFVEFLDMLCRIAILTISLAETNKLEYRVLLLLQIIKDRLSKNGDIWPNEEFTWKDIDENYLKEEAKESADSD